MYDSEWYVMQVAWKDMQSSKWVGKQKHEVNVLVRQMQLERVMTRKRKMMDAMYGQLIRREEKIEAIVRCVKEMKH